MVSTTRKSPCLSAKSRTKTAARLLRGSLSHALKGGGLYALNRATAAFSSSGMLAKKRRKTDQGLGSQRSHTACIEVLCFFYTLYELPYFILINLDIRIWSCFGVLESSVHADTRYTELPPSVRRRQEVGVGDPRHDIMTRWVPTNFNSSKCTDHLSPTRQSTELHI